MPFGFCGAKLHFWFVSCTSNKKADFICSCFAGAGGTVPGTSLVPTQGLTAGPSRDEDPALLEVPAFKVTLLFPSSQKGSLQFMCRFKITWELWPKSYPGVFSVLGKRTPRPLAPTC